MNESPKIHFRFTLPSLIPGAIRKICEKHKLSDMVKTDISYIVASAILMGRGEWTDRDYMNLRLEVENLERQIRQRILEKATEKQEKK